MQLDVARKIAQRYLAGGEKAKARDVYDRLLARMDRMLAVLRADPRERNGRMRARGEETYKELAAQRGRLFAPAE